MPTLDLTRWAIIGVKNETGVGRMAKDLRRCLHPVCQLVLQSYRLAGQPLEAGESAINSESCDQTLCEQLAELQGIIVFDDSDFSRRLIRLAHGINIRTVFVVLWEWLRGYLPEVRQCDLLVCPNHFATKITRGLGLRQICELTWPLDLDPLPRRSIAGKGRSFLHNVGLYEPDDRKGTAEVLNAFRKVRCPDAELIVRVQNGLPLPTDDPRIRIESRHFERHGQLYELGDVAIQPSKCEGLGFMLLEAIAAGMPVITTDYSPMNEYVRHSNMLVATHWGKKPAEQTHYIPQAHFKIPKIAALTKRIEWCADNDLGEISSSNRAWAELVFAPEKVRCDWISALEQICSK
jgi:glycosyltransferase involved in cell wall biosynthesis